VTLFSLPLKITSQPGKTDVLRLWAHACLATHTLTTRHPMNSRFEIIANPKPVSWLRKCAVFTDRFPGGTFLSLRRAWLVCHGLHTLRGVPPRHRNPVNSVSTRSNQGTAASAVVCGSVQSAFSDLVAASPTTASSLSAAEQRQRTIER